MCRTLSRESVATKKALSATRPAINATLSKANIEHPEADHCRRGAQKLQVARNRFDRESFRQEWAGILPAVVTRHLVVMSMLDAKQEKDSWGTTDWFEGGLSEGLTHRTFSM